MIKLLLSENSQFFVLKYLFQYIHTVQLRKHGNLNFNIVIQ